jgi:diadenosine tetraphosphate (Ap4A) HIT family hydrolase
MTITGFALDPRLAADTRPVSRWGLSDVLLMNDARFPWVILVPRIVGVTEWFDLAEGERATLLNETLALGKAMQTLFNAEKINTAALGNVVSQLHVHVVARYARDAAWPAPTWGFGQAEPYESEALINTLDRLSRELPSL